MSSGHHQELHCSGTAPPNSGWGTLALLLVSSAWWSAGDQFVEGRSFCCLADTYLGDELVVVGQVSPAVDAAVGSMAAGQVRLEGLRARHPDHGRSWRAVQKRTASPGRLTGEAPQHTGECRGGGWVGQQTPEQRDDKITEVCTCLRERETGGRLL